MKKNLFIIAEAGVNHNGSLKIAKKIITAAKQAGADAVKFQSYITEEIVTKKATKANYQKKFGQKKESQFSMLKKYELTKKDHFKINDFCKLKKIKFMSTAFDKKSLEFITNNFNMPYLKISSGEITNAPLLLEFAKNKSPIILSTGMSNLKEIENALGVLACGFLKVKPTQNNFQTILKKRKARIYLNKYVTLLHCTSSYPTEFKDINLNIMQSLKDRFKINVGFSDHSSGILAPIVATALGATIIEKHITLNKSMNGPDHKASIEPKEFKKMVSSLRDTELILGSKIKKKISEEIKNQKVARKSLKAGKKISKGELFTSLNVAIKRPNNGKSPFEYWNIIGRKSKKNYKIDDKI